MNRLLAGLTGIAMTLLPVLGAGAEGRPMPITGGTSQPIGHYDFCQRFASECQRNDEIGIIKLTEKSWSKIVQVNAAVNARIFPRTDEDIFGVAEYWTYPTAEGDCEDYALLKQYTLEQAGYPRSALLLTVVRQANGDGHAVLTVRTDQGDFILDNLEERVLDWKATNLKFLKRQSERHAGKWNGIDDERQILVGSIR
jgi:predicted transglutaminase-like cysteine proteinase